MSVEDHVKKVTEMIQTVTKDRRDEWPINGKQYIKGYFLNLRNFLLKFLKIFAKS